MANFYFSFLNNYIWLSRSPRGSSASTYSSVELSRDQVGILSLVTCSDVCSARCIRVGYRQEKRLNFYDIC